MSALDKSVERSPRTSPAFTETRRRAVPAGTLGGRIARTSKPSACNRVAHRHGSLVVTDAARDDLRAVTRHVRVPASRSRRRRRSASRDAVRAVRARARRRRRKARVERVGHRRRRRGREHERPAALHQILDQPSAGPATNAPATPSAFPAVLIDTQARRIQPRRLDEPAAALAVDADRVGLVDDRARRRTAGKERPRHARAPSRRPC